MPNQEMKELRDLADSYEKKAKELDAQGFADQAKELYQSLVQLDMQDDEIKNKWGGPLNGQVGRMEIFEKIIKFWNPLTIIETGTFRGDTTEWLAKVTKAQIFTSETNKRNYFYSLARLEKLVNVNISLLDSRLMINEIASNKDIDKDKVLFYLDAHWNKDLPLVEELQIIFNHFNDPVVIVDDFRVPFDFGYGYDDYGPGKTLGLSILEGVLPIDFVLGFPQIKSFYETGAKRGCTIIARESTLNEIKLSSPILVDSFTNWQLKELNNFESEFRICIDSRIKVLTYHCQNRLEQINELTAISQNRLEQINELTAISQNRLEQINELTKNITNMNRSSQKDNL